MFSFVDLLLISIASGAVFLLLLILVSFILSSRRAAALEHIVEELTSKLAIQNATIDSLTAELSTLNGKLTNTQKTVSYLAKNQEDIIDSQDALKGRVSKLNEKQEVQQKLISQNTSENQSIVLATKLIKQGLSIEEVSKRTNLNSTELEMLYAVTTKEMAKEKSKAEAAQKAKARAQEKAAERVELDVKEDMSIAPQSHRVAGMKARSAYGINGSKSLISKDR